MHPYIYVSICLCVYIHIYIYMYVCMCVCLSMDLCAPGSSRMGAQVWMTVPVFPAMPSAAFSSRVIRDLRPGFDSANCTAA